MQLIPENMTIADLKKFAIIDKSIESFLNKLLCDSYDDFVKNIYDELETCIEFMEEDPKVRKGDGEDRLTTDIIHHFKAKGYLATHDEMIGGHSDIVIKYKKFMWLGEAKIHSDYGYLMKGFQQLCTRYSPGTNNNSNGGLIIYIRTNNASKVIAEWKNRLDNEQLEDYSSSECDTRKGLSFNSTHQHVRSGLPYKVRHMGVVLGFDPKDK